MHNLHLKKLINKKDSKVIKKKLIFLILDFKK
jgi:hypothetical protein